MTRVTVQAAFGYTIADPMVAAGHEDGINSVTYPDGVASWTDITQWADIQKNGVKINRGASDEISETQTGTVNMTLDNDDGRFTPGNASSPYYPNVLKGVPLRVVVTTLEGANFVQTPSFESSSVRGWYCGNPATNCTLTTSTARAYSGTTSMRIAWGSSGDPGMVTTDLYGLTIGDVYTASAYVYVEAGEPAARLGIAGGTTGTASTTTGAWERITVTWTATAAAHTLQVTPSGLGSPSAYTYMDAAQVEEGGAATTFTAAGAQIHPRGLWAVGEWPLKWAGLEATVSITGSDLFKFLSQAEELQPMIVEEALLRGPAAYYPLSESESTEGAGDLAGLGAGTLTSVQAGAGGTLEFGQEGGPLGGLTVPTFTPSSSTAGLYLTGDLGTAFATQSQASGATVWIEMWFTTTATNRVLVGLASPDSQQQLVISLNSSGQPRLQVTDAGDNLTGSFAATASLADGALHHLVYDQGSSKFWVDGPNDYSISPLPLTELRTLYVGGWEGARLWDGQISHVALYALTSSAPGWFTDHHDTGTTGHVGEGADERMARLAAYAGVSVEPSGTSFDGMGDQSDLGSTALSHMREVETTESGKLLASRSTGTITYQSRSVRYNPTPAATLDYADLETGDVEVADDDQKVVNTVEASRPDGATIRGIDQDSIARYGPYKKTLTLYKDSDNGVQDAVSWWISRYADPPPELRQVPLEASTLSLTTYRALLDADVSTALTVTGLPGEAPTPTATVVVEGYEETITEGQHKISFHASRADTSTVWVLDSPTYSVLGTSTRLAY